MSSSKIFTNNLQMIRQSQIRNFISLIARKNLEATLSLAETKPNSEQLILSTVCNKKCRRYETEPIQDAVQPKFSLHQNIAHSEETPKQYIKLSLYEKYRRSLQSKKNQITLKTQCMLEMKREKQSESKSKEIIFPISRPTQSSSKKLSSFSKQRILSIPSHPPYFYRFQKKQIIDEEQKKLPPQSSEDLVDTGQEAFRNLKPMFKIKKYQPLNYRGKISQIHRVLTQDARSQQQKKLYSKLKSGNPRPNSKRLLGQTTIRGKCQVTEVLQENLSGWVVEKSKSRNEYEI